jgi:hypothetical protein
MALIDYTMNRDKFELEVEYVNGFDFPCGLCKHRHGADSDEPCRTCDYNVSAVRDEGEA